MRSALAELLPPVVDVAPGLCGPGDGAAFITAMTRPGNEQSHHFLTADQFDDADADRYCVLAATDRWVLHLRLLLEVTTPNQLRLALRNSDQFGFALANIDRLPH